MKIDFGQQLMTLRGLPILEKSFEPAVVSKVMKMCPGRKFSSLEEILAVLDEAKVSWMEVFKESGVPLYLRDICTEALMLRNVTFSEVLPGREYAIRYRLSVAIMEAKVPLSIKPSEIRLILELIGKLPDNFGPLLTGQASIMLESGEPEESDKNDPPAQKKEPPREPRPQIPQGRRAN
jgi:hypothetical protein